MQKLTAGGGLVHEKGTINIHLSYHVMGLACLIFREALSMAKGSLLEGPFVIFSVVIKTILRVGVIDWKFGQALQHPYFRNVN